MADKELDPYRLTDTDENGCEGCHHCLFAGIRWPASPDGMTDLSYVDRCDYCELYDTDEEAAKALAEHFEVRWGYAERAVYPKTEGSIRWAPPEDDGLDYTGWSVFIEHEAYDGHSAYARQGEWVQLPLNPGQAHALVAAITSYRAHFGAEWGAGEMWALAVGRTLEDLRDQIDTALVAANPPTGDDV
jgi:hypothetical protein